MALAFILDQTTIEFAQNLSLDDVELSFESVLNISEASLEESPHHTQLAPTDSSTNHEQEDTSTFNIGTDQDEVLFADDLSEDDIHVHEDSSFESPLNISYESIKDVDSPVATSSPKKKKNAVASQDVYEFTDDDDGIPGSSICLDESLSSVDESSDGLSDLSMSSVDSKEDSVPSSDISARPPERSNTHKKKKVYIKKTGKTSMKKARRVKCKCKKKCMENISIDDLKAARREYWSKTPHQRREWLFGQFCSSQDFCHFRLPNGNTVCQVAFYSWIGISRASFFNIKSAAMRNESGASTRYHGRQRSQATIACMNWLEGYFSRRGDCMPHKDEVRLPHGYSKKDIYQDYLSHMAASELMEPTVAKSHFYQVWKDFFPQVKVKKVS